MLMRIFLPVGFVFAALGAVFGVLLFTQDLENDPARIDLSGQTEVRPLGTAVAMVWQDLTSAFVPTADADLASFLPEPPAGWSRAPFETADAEAITGARLQQSVFSIDTTNDTILALHMAESRSNKTNLVQTYRNGESMVVVHVRFTPGRELRTVRGDMAAQVNANMEGFGSIFSALDEDTSPRLNFTVDGVAFSQMRQTNMISASREQIPVSYRRFKAGIGQQFDISVLSNADDAAVQAIVAGIDVAGMNAAMESPDPQVVAGAGLLLEPVEVASATPVPPQAALQAFASMLGMAGSAPEPTLVQDSVAVEPAAPPVVRRAGEVDADAGGATSCRIEAGVRRCRVGN